ncbi:MAG: nickel pincer cofactor biosynthesis protein LarC [Sedimentisphaerales bacterium]|nr:nickel pincer cofactor biosynthesis protein LarC [Sedimentisphaerales bacterium]
MKIAYFDCFGGAAGDMIVGACLDAGLSADRLRGELAKLNLPDIELQIKKVTKKGISATAFVPAGTSKQPCRHLSQIIELIRAADLSARVRQRAVAIFERLGQAEAKIHQRSVEEIHFHEVGAADAILDIVGACVALEALEIEQIICSPLAVGSGTIRCAHGTLPVPAPATAELIKGVPLRTSNVEGELLTPTGAAILTTLAERFGSLPEMTIEAIGYGAGQRDLEEQPNVLRLIVGRTDDAEPANATAGRIAVLETNLDDATGELIGHLGETLMQAGALDVFFTPVVMKKNRPGTQITVLAPVELADLLTERLLTESTTFGVRRHVCDRTVLARSHRTVETQFGPIRIKIGTLGDRPVTCSPEYEDCRQAARRHGATLKSVMAAAMIAWGSRD